MSSTDSQIMNYLVRMVVPMRREFGRSLDVQHFLHDVAYAREVLEHAHASRDQRLREYAAYVENALHGVRAGTLAPATPAPAAVLPAPLPQEAMEATADEEQEMKASIMKKYTAGLR
jgi:hypothetical protein